jgi:hypothetical protein
MKKTLQDQYLLIKEGKGHKGVFLTEAKRQFPNIVRNAATFEEATASLITKNIITENVIGLTAVNSPFEPKKKESYELAYEAFLAEAKKKENEDEKVKAEEKKVSKPVENDLSHNFDRKDEKNPDNLIFDQIMTGYYTEMKDPKNADKTMQELKDIVFKNLAKDPIFYTKEGQFGVKDLGYTVDAPGLGAPKEAKGKYKSSGYGDLNEGQVDMNKSYPTIKSTGTKIEYKGKPGTIAGNFMVRGEEFASYKVKFDDGTTDEINTSDKNIKFLEESLEESKLRKVIREMIDAELEEAYQMPSVNTSNTSGAGGGRRFIPSLLPFPVNIRKRFGDHMVYNPGNGTFYISDILYNNLVKGYANQPAIKKLIMDIPPMVKQLLNKTENFDSIVELPKQFKTYHPFKEPVDKAKEDKFNKAGDKQYWSEGDFLFPNLNIMEEEMAESLMEGVEKDLMAINKEAEHEVLQSKMDKIQALIDKKQSQLSKLDEDEDMKSLTDDKKVKEISKDIKALEKAKAKLEKMMGKVKGKAKKTEVLGEIEVEPSEEYLAAKADAENRYEEGELIDSILSNYPNLPLNDRNMLRQDLEAKFEGTDND